MMFRSDRPWSDRLRNQFNIPSDPERSDRKQSVPLRKLSPSRSLRLPSVKFQNVSLPNTQRRVYESTSFIIDLRHQAC